MNWLENSFLARLINETIWGFPINEVVHILSFSVVLGCVVLVTARMFGLSQVQLRPLVRFLTPWFIVGFSVALITGLSFFASRPEVYLSNPSFLTKIVLLVGLVSIVLVFYFKYWRNPVALVEGEAISNNLKGIAVFAAVLVFGILLAGRLIPYAGYF